MLETDDLMGPVNLGNPKESTILEIAEKLIAMTRSRSRIIFKALPSDDPERRCPDISLARTKLGWSPGFHWKPGWRELSNISEKN